MITRPPSTASRSASRVPRASSSASRSASWPTLAWAVAIPLLFNPWWAVLAFYLACSWFVGFLLAIVFQLAHCVDVTDDARRHRARRGEDFAVHQLRTTADIASPVPVLGHVFRWLVGGLDHQIEHHLAPVPDTLYPRVAACFRAGLRGRDRHYHLHPGVWSALRSHTRWLRLSSTLKVEVRCQT